MEQRNLLYYLFDLGLNLVDNTGLQYVFYCQSNYYIIKKINTDTEVLYELFDTANDVIYKDLGLQILLNKLHTIKEKGKL